MKKFNSQIGKFPSQWRMDDTKKSGKKINIQNASQILTWKKPDWLSYKCILWYFLWHMDDAKKAQIEHKNCLPSIIVIHVPYTVRMAEIWCKISSYKSKLPPILADFIGNWRDIGCFLGQDLNIVSSVQRKVRILHWFSTQKFLGWVFSERSGKAENFRRKNVKKIKQYNYKLDISYVGCKDRSNKDRLLVRVFVFPLSKILSR